MIGSTAIPIGIPGLELAPGDHLCAFYRGPAERDEILALLVRSGMDAGHKCICIIDRETEATLRNALTDDVDVENCVACGQLELLPVEKSYLRGGSFTAEEMLEFWGARVGGAVATGRFGFVRALADATWAMEDPRFADEFVAYEAELNRFLPQFPQVVICLYDIDRFRGDILVDILKTHPKVLLGSMVLENPYYVNTVHFLTARRR